MVDAYGSSSGGYYAFGAAAITANIRRLVLYEGWPLVDPDATTPPAELLDRVEAKLAEGDREGALETVYREYLQLTKEEFEELRAQPSWPTRVAAAHTIPRESRPGADPKLDPDQAARITVPTLLLVGEESPEHLKVGSEHVVDALPNARVAILKGQGHAADLFAPQVIADVLLSFLREQP